ncbi:MAG: hypothetical protein PHQ04_04040 [Opitutaceae bacterium]|nr:hypothetical protein [Opitutaceae bacterium]
MHRILPLSLLFLVGCTTPPAPTPDEVRANAAVKDRYWRMQAAQQTGPHRSVPILQPERVEDGARRVPTVIQLEYP